MSETPISDRLRAHSDSIAPAITMADVAGRPPSPPSQPWRSALLLGSLVIAILVGLVLAALVLAPGDTESVETAETSAENSPNPPAAIPEGPREWPVVLSAVASRPEVLLSSMQDGEIVDRFAPPNLADGELSGAVGSPDGRVAAWSGAEVAVQHDGVTHELTINKDTLSGALRVVFLPLSPAVWIVATDGAETLVFKWDYSTKEIARAQVSLPTLALPAGVGMDGRLVLNSDDPLAQVGDEFGTTTVIGPGLSDPVVTVEGLAMGVGSTMALIRSCDSPSRCSLSAVELASGKVASIDSGDVSPASVRSLIGPTVPFETAPLPTAAPGSERVLVSIEIGPSVQQDQATIVATVDLEGLILESIEDPLQDVIAAVWNCDGTEIAGLTGDGIWHLEPNGSANSVLPDGTFLYGFGKC